MKSVLLVLWLWSCAALAEPTYPARPITVVIPFGAGGDSDLFARNMASKIQKYLNHATFVIDNRVGHSGVTATAFVAAAPADGHTMLIGRVSPLIVMPAIDNKLPYHWQDFTVLGILEIDPLICAVKGSAPWQTPRDLMAAIRKQPGHFKYGDSGMYSINDLAMRYWLSLSGLKPDVIAAQHFNSGVELTNALHEDKIQVFCGVAASLLPAIHAGSLRALFTTSSGRLPELPELKNANEVGLRDMGKIFAWTAIAGPKDLPLPVIQRWKSALNQLANDVSWVGETARRGGQPALNAIADPDKFLADQSLLYQRMIAILDIKK